VRFQKYLTPTVTGSTPGPSTLKQGNSVPNGAPKTKDACPVFILISPPKSTAAIAFTDSSAMDTAADYITSLTQGSQGTFTGVEDTSLFFFFSHFKKN
jgi:hypothetical protein